MQVNGNGCEDSPSRYHVMAARTPGATPTGTATSYALPGTPTLLEEGVIKSESSIHLRVAALVEWDICSPLSSILTEESIDMLQCCYRMCDICTITS